MNICEESLEARGRVKVVIQQRNLPPTAPLAGWQLESLLLSL